MKRFYNAILVAVLAMLAVLPPAFAQNTSGDTAPGQTSTTGQSIQSSFPATLPETRFKNNVRFPNLAIFGGNQNANNPGDWSTLGSPLSVYQYLPSIVLRPAGKKATDNLDTFLQWTTPSSTGSPARLLTIPDVGASSGYFVVSSGTSTGLVAKDKEYDVNIGTGSAALANSTTFTYVIAPGRAGVVNQISIAALVAPIGGTNTVTIKKNNSANMLSAASFDPTTLTANVASQPALTATTANLTLAATDTITVTYTSGVQTTAAQAPTVTIEMLPNDY